MDFINITNPGIILLDEMKLSFQKKEKTKGLQMVGEIKGPIYISTPWVSN